MADAHGSATPAPPDIMRPAAMRLEEPRLRPRVTSFRQWWDYTSAPPAIFPFPRSRPRPLSALPRPAPAAPGSWTEPLAVATSPPPPPAFHHVRPRKRRAAGPVSLNSWICRATCRRIDGTRASPARRQPV